MAIVNTLHYNYEYALDDDRLDGEADERGKDHLEGGDHRVVQGHVYGLEVEHSVGEGGVDHVEQVEPHHGQKLARRSNVLGDLKSRR